MKVARRDCNPSRLADRPTLQGKTPDLQVRTDARGKLGQHRRKEEGIIACFAAQRPMIIRTERLILRPWRSEDRAPFAELNADPRVMEHFPGVLSAQESDHQADRIMAHFALHGYGLFALEEAASGRFLGFTGLNNVAFEAHFTPCVEIGWRLAFDCWGQGYALEAAEASLEYAFENLKLGEVVSFTSRENLRSRRVMERLQMTHNSHEDFEHPLLPSGHRLRAHVLYRKSAPRVA